MPKKWTIDDLLNVVYPTTPALSPDGQWVIYQTATASMEENAYRHDLWIVPCGASRPPFRLTEHEPVPDDSAEFRVSWSPDSSAIAWLPPGGGLAQTSIEDGRATGTRKLIDGQAEEPASGHISALRWSPDGRRLAIITAHTPKSGPPSMAAVEMDITRYPTLGDDFTVAEQVPPPPSSLEVVDALSGALVWTTDASFDVKTFGWAPDSRQIAFSAIRDDAVGLGHYLEGCLYLADLDADEVKTLVDQRGGDAGPVFSPDGSRIAFWSQMGSEAWGWSYVVTPAVVSVNGGEPAYPLSAHLEELDAVYWDNDLVWSADGGHLLFLAQHDLTSDLFRVAASGGVPEHISTDPDLWYDEFSFAGGRVAFTVQSPTRPPDIHVSELEAFTARRLTDVNPWVAGLAEPRVRRLSWKSSDGRWDIEGYLLLPPGHEDGRTMPTLVEAVGGPAMVPTKFPGSWAPFPNLIFASEGYAVLVPNTRGRHGFGVSFRRAQELEGSFALGGLEDLHAGVDSVVARGIADPTRLGVMGHSYGGALTGHAITRNRFHAAAFHEGVVELVRPLLLRYGSPTFRAHMRNQGGVGSPYCTEDLATVMRESAIYAIDRARTPSLIEAGELSLPEQAAILASGLAYHGVPHEFVLYPRTGHVFLEPVLRVDAYTRQLAWFGYWLLDRPLPDPVKQEKFDVWKRASLPEAL
ncbi:prolyl oligopeptidase family serine peptidase [Streptomyces sp. NPDC002285]